ncbi:MAG: hypothetical protein ACFB6S_11310 [Geminicoccaceae bacterium]
MRDYQDETARREAAVLLDDLVRQLPGCAGRSASLPEPWRDLGLPWTHLDNVEGIHVYRAPLGGWHCDVKLKSAPAGRALVVGSPSAAPHRSRDEALASAVQILGAFARPPARGSTHETRERAVCFWLYGHKIILPEMLFELARAEHLLRPAPADAVIAWLETELASLGLLASEGAEPSMAKLTADQRLTLLGVLCRAQAAGVFRFPPAKPLSPSGHPPHLTTQ